MVVSILAYSLTLRNGFVTDDNSQILMNPIVKESQSLGTIFGTDVWSFSHDKTAANGVSNYYRPLQILVYSAEYTVFGDRPFGWHAVNLLLNAAVVVAAYLLIAALAAPELAFWSALLFALHPMHIEAVAWVAALPELQCALLMIVAMLFYHRARTAGNTTLNLAISTAAFLGALFSKETALLFPAILFSYEYFYRQEKLLQLWRSLRWIWPSVAALAIYVIARLHALGAFAPLQQPARAPLSRTQLLLAVPPVLARYLGKLLAPIGMNYFYAFPMPDTFGWWTIIGFLAVALTVAWMFVLRGRQPLLAFSIAWFLLTMAPALSLNRIGENFFTERYLYIPSLGFCVLVASGWLWMRRKFPRGRWLWAPWAIGAVLLAFYAAQVERRIPVFRSDFSLLTDTVLKSPNSGAVHSLLAAEYYRRGELEPAIEHMTRAVELIPNLEIGLLDLAQYLGEEKRYDEAVVRLKQAVALRPNYRVARINLAKAYTEKGDWANAADSYRRLAEMDPDHDSYYRQLATMAESNGKAQAELDRKRNELEREPHGAETLVQLGDAYARVGRWAEAARELQKAAAKDPGSLQIWTKLGVCLEQTTDKAGAIDAFNHALAINPDFLLARKYLATALSDAGRIDESTAQLQMILANNPQYEHADEIHFALGVNLEKKGDDAGAAREYELALQANPNFPDAQKRLTVLRQDLGNR